MTFLGGIIVLVATLLFCLWALDLVRRGRLYVGYGIVVLLLICLVASVSILPPTRRVVASLIDALFPSEPVAVLGLSAVLVLLVYVLNQLSVLSDRVSTLTQELAIRQGSSPPPSVKPEADEGP